MHICTACTSVHQVDICTACTAGHQVDSVALYSRNQMLLARPTHAQLAQENIIDRAVQLLTLVVGGSCCLRESAGKCIELYRAVADSS